MNTPPFFNLFFTNLFLIGIVLIPYLYLLVIVDRKLAASLQARVGPKESGRLGFWQPGADILKLLFKTQKPISLTKTALFVSSIVFYIIAATSVPYGSFMVVSETELGVFMPVILVLVGSFGMFLSAVFDERYSFVITAIRQAVVSLAAVLPVIITLLVVGISQGSFSWATTSDNQGFFPLSWNLFNSPFVFGSFFIFLVAGCFFTQFPFGLINGQIQKGEFSNKINLSGYRLVFIRLIYLFSILMITSMLSIVYLGGYQIPEAIQSTHWSSGVLEIGVLLTKMGLITVGMTLITLNLVKLNTIQINKMIWKYLIPISSVVLLGELIWKIVF